MMNDPCVYATFERYLKIHFAGHAIKIQACYFKLDLLQSELGDFGIAPSLH